MFQQLFLVAFLLFSVGTVHAPDQAPALEPEAVLWQLAEALSSGDYEGAIALMTPELGSVYASFDYAPLRNTPKMTILSLEPRGQRHWLPDYDRNGPEIAEYRLFLMEVEYEVLGLSDSYYADGQPHLHRVTLIRYADQPDWLISGLGGISQ